MPDSLSQFLRHHAKWVGVGALVGLSCGIASAIFLKLLYGVTEMRFDRPWLIAGLPLAGFGVWWLYDRFGRGLEGGNNLLLERVNDAGEPVPVWMAPLILSTTVLTHLFGGSAGREGTAVQMGGAMVNMVAQPLRLGLADRPTLIMAGISGGFGSVFGTPLAGAVFGLEVATLGRIRLGALVPCVVASFVGDFVCRGLGTRHHGYPRGLSLSLDPATLGLVLLAGIAFAGAASGFTSLTHGVQRLMGRIPRPWLRPVVGGAVVVLLTLVVGTQDYNGLSLGLIEQSFGPAGSVMLAAFAFKILFTAATLGSGFKGGEVTPLFCVGATLGHSFGQVAGQPAPVFAALGFAAVFAGAANTPVACALMGVELFGLGLALPLLVTCMVASSLSSPRGIYWAQRSPGQPSGGEIPYGLKKVPWPRVIQRLLAFGASPEKR
jgi:H+/Cl- antiporter ClcA